jgi:hypothetical protein
MLGLQMFKGVSLILKEKQYVLNDNHSLEYNVITMWHEMQIKSRSVGRIILESSASRNRRLRREDPVIP